MRPDVSSDVGDILLTFAFLSFAPFIVNTFIVALHKGVKGVTKFVLTGAFLLRPGMTLYRTFRTSLSVDSCRLRLRNLLLNQRPPEEISLQMTIVARAEKELKTWRGLSEKLFHCQLYLEHIPSLIVLFQIGFGGTYLWTESMGNIQTQILVRQLFEAPPYLLCVILSLTSLGVVAGQWRSAHFNRMTHTGILARLVYAAFIVVGNLGSYGALYASMVLGLIYGMVEHTYFQNLLILYALIAAKFAVVFAVSWAISEVFRNEISMSEKVIKSLAQVLCPNIFDDLERDHSPDAWRRNGLHFLAVHAVHLVFNFLIIYANNIFHDVPFPLPGGYATLLAMCAAVSVAQLVPAYAYYRLLHPRKIILDRELFGRQEAVNTRQDRFEVDGGDENRVESYWAFERVWKDAPYAGVTVKPDLRQNSNASR